MLTRDSKRSIRTNSVNNSHNEDGFGVYNRALSGKANDIDSVRYTSIEGVWRSHNPKGGQRFW